MSYSVVSTYESNPIGHLQERLQKEGKDVPVYEMLSEVGSTHKKEFVMQVTLPNGLKVEGTASTKKAAKHMAAKAMLDILDGRAKAINDDVRDSIDQGLKALRGTSESIDTGLKALRGVVKPKTRDPTEWDSLTSPYVFEPSSRLEKEIRKKEKKRKVSKPRKPKFPPIQENFIKSKNAWLEEIILNSLYDEIDRRKSLREPELDEICKMCNLVFVNESYCIKHKKGEFHVRVLQSEYPGKGSHHCLLCWINFLQPEGLLSHISRPNHQALAKKEGVLKLLSEPSVENPAWDTIQMFKDLREITDGYEQRSRRSRSRSRSPRRRMKGRGRSPDEDIKSGVSGDWRLGREKTLKENEKIREQERRAKREAERRLHLKRERDERMRRDWDRKMREREELRYRQREEDRRRREREEIYWRQREEQEWREWKEREDRRWREEMERRRREDLEWRRREEIMFRNKEEEHRKREDDYLGKFESRSEMKSKHRQKNKKHRKRKEDDSELEDGEYDSDEVERQAAEEQERPKHKDKKGKSRKDQRNEQRDKSDGHRRSKISNKDERHRKASRDEQIDLRELLRRRKTESATKEEEEVNVKRSRSSSTSSSSESSSDSSSSKSEPSAQSSSSSESRTPTPKKISRKIAKRKKIKIDQTDAHWKSSSKLLRVRSSILSILDEEIDSMTYKD